MCWCISRLYWVEYPQAGHVSVEEEEPEEVEEEEEEEELLGLLLLV